jgi:hypothetical protein
MDKIESKHFILTKQDIKIFWYFFPFGTKTIPLSCIEYVTSDDETYSWLFYKTWGQAFSRVWWHLDMNRFRNCCIGKNGGYNPNRPHLIIKVRDDELLKAVSMETRQTLEKVFEFFQINQITIKP